MATKQEIRRNTIISEVEKNNGANISELSKKLKVSEMTIRRDLKILEEEGSIIRTYKGAILSNNGIDDSLNRRIMQNKKEKRIIGQFVAGMIDNDDIIMLDASTTALEICHYIKDKKITVVTNSISVPNILRDAENVNVIITGGTLRRSSLSLVGSDAISSFEKFNFKKAFISAKALSFEHGLTDINMFEIETKKAAISKAEEVIVMIDNSKLNKVSLQKVCRHKSIDKIVIDGLRKFTSKEQETLDTFKSYGIEVIIVKDEY